MATARTTKQFVPSARQASPFRIGALLALLFGLTTTGVSAETLMMPNRDMLRGTAAAPAGPGAAGEVVWGVTTLPNHTAGLPTTYSINFGDGSANATGNVIDRSFIAVNHVYAVAGTFTATLQIVHGLTVESATVQVRVFDAVEISAEQLRGVNTNRAIEDGLRYLWVSQSGRTTNFPNAVTTNWGAYPQPHAALIVLAFENHGYQLPNSDAAPTGLYQKYVVRRGLNYVIDQLNQRTLTVQTAGDPCVNVDDGPAPCIGLGTNLAPDGYATSIAILPLAASNALNRRVAEITGSAGGGYVVGKTYGEVLQRLINTMAWGQGESGNGRGGWHYSFNDGNTDGSTIGWNVLALLDAAAGGITVPAFVKAEFVNHAIRLGLNMHPAGPNNIDGTFDYTADNNPSSSFGGTSGPNMAKNGIGVQAMFYADLVGLGNAQVARARNSISNRWNAGVAGDTYACTNGLYNKGCAYAMFNVFKALKLQGITTLPSVTRPAGPGTIPAGDWYADYVDWLLANQTDPTGLAANSGSWSGGTGKVAISFSASDNSSAAANAAMAELILSPVALIAPDPTLFSTVGLGPSTALLAPGGSHTVTATATSAGGAAVAGATVNFSVLTGPNQGKSGQSVTSAGGIATFTYPDDGGPGRDTIQAFIGTLGSNIVEALWQVPDCGLGTVSASLASSIFPIDQGWRGVSINGAPGATVTQVCQDEPPNFENIAAWAVDANGVGTSAASIRAQRSGTRTAPGNGRVYHVYFTASSCSGKVTVGVPAVAGGTAVDGGPLFNSVTGASCSVQQIPTVVAAPAVIGDTQAVASAKILAASLRVGTVSQLNSPTIPAGQVMSQIPGAGTSVALGSAVAITISSGPSSVGVPSVVGQSQANATAAIQGVGLVVGLTQVNDPLVPAGLVMAQGPPAGTQVPPNSAVSVTVSLGPAVTTVPNVVGLPLAGAVSAATGAALNLGTVNLVYDPGIPDGIVMVQNPAAGGVVSPGSFIDFTLSLGPQPVPVPSLAGQTEAAAQAAVVAGSLVVGNISHVNDALVPSGKVISQTPAAGALVAPGSAVSFAVSLGPVMVPVPNVVGQPQGAAQTAIASAGLAVGSVTTSNHPSVAAGAVISQAPSGGNAILGSAVNLVISLGPTPVVVPNVVGQIQGAAETSILAATLAVGTITPASSPTVPAGNVMGQSPLAGTTLLPGASVNLIVSTGPVIVNVPDVVGQDQSTALAAISGVGLAIGQITLTNSAVVPANAVISQLPAGNATAILGSSVNLTLSLGVSSVAVPNVVGLQQATASANLVAGSVVVGTVTTANSGTVPVGGVIDQSPIAGSIVPQNSGVNLLVSLGPVTVAVPTVVGSTEAAAIAAITANFGATVSFAPSPTVAQGNVISQNPVGGTNAPQGSTVSIVVSTGTVAATVPNVVDQAEGAAGTAITGAGLIVGNVTAQNSAKAAGLVVSQTPVGGASALGGSTVDLVISLGPAPGVPAFLEITLSSQVLGAGAASTISTSVLDGFSVPVLPTPGVSFQILAGPGATGTAPTVNGNQVLTSANTRGAYTLRGTVNSIVVTDEVAFTVLDGSAASKNVGKFIKLGVAESTVSTRIEDLFKAYQNLAQASDVTTARAALIAALVPVPIVGKDAMQRSTAVAPETGFLPSEGAMNALFPLTVDDQAFGSLIIQISEKLEEITAFYLALNPDALGGGGGDSVQQLNLLNGELAALQAQLADVNVTPRGIVRYAPYINRLMGHVVPKHLHAVANKVGAVAQLYPDPANLPLGVARMPTTQQFFAALESGKGVTPATFYGKGASPAFFGLLGLMGGSSIQMKLVNEIYGPIMTEVSEMMLVLALNGLIETYGNTAFLGEIVSGGSLSFHASGIGGSSIEGSGFDTTSAAGNETWFIGPEAFDLVKNLIQSFNPSNVESIEDVWDYFEGIANAVNASFEGYERAHTQPDEVAQGQCLLDDSFGCKSLYFNAGGFPDVNSTRFPSPVIVILHNTNNGSWSSGIFNFVP